MLIQDRIKLILKANNLSASEFADEVGVKRSNLSHVLSGRNKPSLDFLSKIITTFPKVNASWLLTGDTKEGDFTGGNDVKIQKEKTIVPTKIANKEIEKIVTFYSDETYTIYRPSEK